MKLTLVGPDDSGFWFLENQHGMTWQIVERWGDHPGAAVLFGWVAAEGATDDEQVGSAREFLMENIGAEIEAPLHIAQYFDELEREAVEEKDHVQRVLIADAVAQLADGGEEVAAVEPGQFFVEAAAGPEVGQVELDAALACLLQIVVHLAVFVGPGDRATETVRRHVTGAKPLGHELPEWPFGQKVAEINHDWDSRRLARLDRAVDGLPVGFLVVG